MPPTPLVSICLPNLNTRPFLEERMESILSQTFGDWELIISDNYSEDGAWDFFQTFRTDPRVHLSQAPRRGMYANWNECLRRATGKYVYIATSDDTMQRDCLEKLVRPLEQRPEIKISVCDFQEIDKNSAPLARLPWPHHAFLTSWMQTPSIRNGKTEFLLHAAFGSIWVTLTSVLFRRDLLAKAGLFRTDLGSRADEEWVLRAALASDVAFVPGKLATWRIHAGQATYNWSSSSKRALVLRECIRSVMQDEASGIPSAWKQVPGWQHELSAHHRWEVRDALGLYRWEAKRSPIRFLKHIGVGLRTMPGYVFARGLRGFGPEAGFEPATHAARLIELFNAPWPPTPMPTA